MFVNKKLNCIYIGACGVGGSLKGRFFRFNGLDRQDKGVIPHVAGEAGGAEGENLVFSFQLEWEFTTLLKTYT